MAIDVAAGVLLDAQGRVLLARRPQGKVYAGWWEVPGGKFEPGESAHEALVRELREELGVVLLSSSAWCQQEYRYAHGHVRLHFRRTWCWRGKPRPLEQQQFVWIDPKLCRDTIPGPVLPATLPIIDWLSFPPRLDAADPRVAQLRLLEAPSDSVLPEPRPADGMPQRPGLTADCEALLEEASARSVAPIYLRSGTVCVDWVRIHRGTRPA
jgi:mutator protein MutT